MLSLIFAFLLTGCGDKEEDTGGELEDTAVEVVSEEETEESEASEEEGE